MNELRMIASTVGVKSEECKDLPPEMEAWHLSKNIIAMSPSLTLLVTLGARGVLVVRHGSARDPLFRIHNCAASNSQPSARLYPALAPPPDASLNESGAGDCLAAGVICSALQGCSESRCIGTGLAAALASLLSPYAVPNRFPDMHAVDDAVFETITSS